VLLVAGVVSTFMVLFKRVGRASQVGGTIEILRHYPQMRVLETRIRLKPGWKGHKAGQFAFVTFDEEEGAHPYTIGSAWKPDENRITFFTKALGDYTRQLPERLKSGESVKIEGPYGRFVFEDNRKRQIWIGGGIGIAPFIARMKQLALKPHDQVIDLFHATTELEDSALEKLKADAKAANVRLHVLVDER
ncbi:MAG: ferric reductase, partial [Planctomycetes bacterium]|nr:ferric reductase [Planctomycetota bacterium]